MMFELTFVLGSMARSKSVAVQNNFDLERHYDQMQQILLEQKSKDSLKVFLKDDLLTIRLASQDSFDSGKTRT